METVSPLLVAVGAIAAAYVAGLVRPWLSQIVGGVSAAIGFALVLWLYLTEASPTAVPWIPAWGVELAFGVDGLAAVFALVVFGVGAAIMVYSAGYMPHELGEQGRPRKAQLRFDALMLTFLASMVGLVLARDLILLFVFWDLTALMSFFLIGFNRGEESRTAALMAILVTGIGGVFLLIAVLILYVEVGSFSLDESLAAGLSDKTATIVGALIVLAAMAKSAQVPFQFWLPNAMVAPTPVSAYLHSSAMVAAGIFLTARMLPVLQQSPLVWTALPWIGVVSIIVGGAVALRSDKLKEILAYSTIAQYGYGFLLLGLGGAHGATGAMLFIIVHALAKATLFMVAGAVTHATGSKRLSEVGGLAKDLPHLAVATAIAVAGLAAIPGTLGFFKEEYLFDAALEHGPLFVALSVIAAALTLAYLGRFFVGIFLGEKLRSTEPIPPTMWIPPLGLALLLIVGGLYPAPFAALAEAGGVATLQEALSLPAPWYHLELRPGYLMAVVAWTLGAALWFAFGRQDRPRLSELMTRYGPERWHRGAISALDYVSAKLLFLEQNTLRTRIASVLVPCAALVAIAALTTPAEQVYHIGEIRSEHVPVILGLFLAAATSLSVTLVKSKGHLTMVLALTAVGCSLAAVYAFLGGPDVALVAVLMELLLTLVFLGVLRLIRRDVLEREQARPETGQPRWFLVVVSILSGGFAFVLAWRVLSHPLATDPTAGFYRDITTALPQVNMVASIIADFRGLDTLGEMTVLLIAMLGIVSLLRRRVR